jgi:hypothetical protein
VEERKEENRKGKEGRGEKRRGEVRVQTFLRRSHAGSASASSAMGWNGNSALEGI